MAYAAVPRNFGGQDPIILFPFPVRCGILDETDYSPYFRIQVNSILQLWNVSLVIHVWPFCFLPASSTLFDFLYLASLLQQLLSLSLQNMQETRSRQSCSSSIVSWRHSSWMEPRSSLDAKFADILSNFDLCEWSPFHGTNVWRHHGIEALALLHKFKFLDHHNSGSFFSKVSFGIIFKY